MAVSDAGPTIIEIRVSQNEQLADLTKYAEDNGIMMEECGILRTCNGGYAPVVVPNF